MFERVTIRTINSDGWPIDFELKEGQSPKPAIDWLASHGYQPAPGAAVTITAPAANAPEAETAVHALAVEQMTATVADGKVYWKVKGGQFQQFGISVWPETLEAAGFDPEALNPMKPVDLTGWTAHYITKEDGKPKKVVRLTN